MKRLTKKAMKDLMLKREEIENENVRNLFCAYAAMQSIDVEGKTDEEKEILTTNAIFNIGVAAIKLLNEVTDEIEKDMKEESK